MEKLGYEVPPISPVKRRWLATWMVVTGGTLGFLLFVAVVIIALIVLLLWLAVKLMMFVAPML